jgi:hypothetical protein
MLQGFNISPSSPDNFWGKAGGNLANSKRPGGAIQRMVRLWTNTSPNAGLQYCSDAGFRDLTEFLPVWHADWNHARTKVDPETTACGPASKPFGIWRLQLLVLDLFDLSFRQNPGAFLRAALNFPTRPPIWAGVAPTALSGIVRGVCLSSNIASWTSRLTSRSRSLDDHSIPLFP